MGGARAFFACVDFAALGLAAVAASYYMRPRPPASGWNSKSFLYKFSISCNCKLIRRTGLVLWRVDNQCAGAQPSSLDVSIPDVRPATDAVGVWKLVTVPYLFTAAGVVR